MKFYFTILSILFSLLQLKSYGQGLTSSPYSQFGFGEINQEGSFVNRSFAKGGTAYASTLGNNLNNAATLAYLSQTCGDFSLDNRANFYKSSADKSFQNNVSFYNLSLAFPVSKRMGWAFGFLPYSAKGYKLSYYQSIKNVGLANYRYEGSGNIGRVYLGTGIKLLSINKDSISASIGTHFNYLFGSNYQRGTVEFNPSYKYLSTKYNSFNYYNGFYFDPSLYLHSRTKNRLYSIGLSYQLASSVNVINSYYAESYYLTASQTSAVKDIFLEKIDTGKTTMPSAIKAGLYTEDNNGNGFALDYQLITFNKVFDKNITAKPMSTISATWQYDARKASKNGFFNNTIYRVGLFYSQTNIVINNDQIANMGLTAALSMPTPGKFAYNKINIGITLGQQGSAQNNLVNQKYIMANVGILFGDIWFKRAKID